MAAPKQTISLERRAFLTVDEAGAYIPASRSKVYQLLNEGRLVGRKLDNRTLIARSSLDEFLGALPAYEGAAS
jgi:excisionase family DNA binding protein